RTEGLLHLGEGGVDGRGIRHIGTNGEGPLGSFTGTGGDRHLVTLRDEALCDGAADAAVSAGDEDDAIAGHGGAPESVRRIRSSLPARRLTPCAVRWDAGATPRERPVRERYLPHAPDA